MHLVDQVQTLGAVGQQHDGAVRCRVEQVRLTTASAVASSRPSVGSSRTRTGWSARSARARAMRRRSPPETSAPRWPRRCPGPRAARRTSPEVGPSQPATSSSSGAPGRARREVGPQGRGEEVRVVGDQPDDPPHVVGGELLQVRSAEQHRPLLGAQEAQEERRRAWTCPTRTPRRRRCCGRAAGSGKPVEHAAGGRRPSGRGRRAGAGRTAGRAGAAGTAARSRRALRRAARRGGRAAERTCANRTAACGSGTSASKSPAARAPRPPASCPPGRRTGRPWSPRRRNPRPPHRRPAAASPAPSPAAQAARRAAAVSSRVERGRSPRSWCGTAPMAVRSGAPSSRSTTAAESAARPGAATAAARRDTSGRRQRRDHARDARRRRRAPRRRTGAAQAATGDARRPRRGRRPRPAATTRSCRSSTASTSETTPASSSPPAPGAQPCGSQRHQPLVHAGPQVARARGTPRRARPAARRSAAPGGPRRRSGRRPPPTARVRTGGCCEARAISQAAVAVRPTLASIAAAPAAAARVETAGRGPGDGDQPAHVVPAHRCVTAPLRVADTAVPARAGPVQRGRRGRRRPAAPAGGPRR